MAWVVTVTHRCSGLEAVHRGKGKEFSTLDYLGGTGFVLRVNTFVYTLIFMDLAVSCNGRVKRKPAIAALGKGPNGSAGVLLCGLESRFAGTPHQDPQECEERQSYNIKIIGNV